MRQGNLTPLPGELELFGNMDMSMVKCKVQGCLLKKAQNARKTLQQIVNAEESPPDGERVMDLVMSVLAFSL